MSESASKTSGTPITGGENNGTKYDFESDALAMYLGGMRMPSKREAMLKVMIAEDDPFAAETIEFFLGTNGYDVCGVASTVREAVELGHRHQPDFAILDVQLAEGGLGMDIATRLNSNGHRTGILYATGKIGDIRLTKANGDAYLGKPYRPEDIILSLRIVEQIVRGGGASPPFPMRFRVLA
jgi:CheY-like chemotaxis protein